MRKNILTVLLIILLSLLFCFCMRALFANDTTSSSVQKTVEDETQDFNVLSAIKRTENETTFQDLKNNNSSMGKDKTMSVLIIGTDERGQEKSRSDVLIVSQYNPSTQVVKLISIPRDTKIHLDGYGTQKINAVNALAGPEAAVEEVSDLLGITLDGYVSVNFNGFIEVIDAIGGLEVDVQKDMKWRDNDFNKTFHLKAGKQTLDGLDLLFYVRFRNDTAGDYGRSERQREVIQGFTKKILSFNTLTKLPELINIVSNNIKTNLNIQDMIGYVSVAKDINSIQFVSDALKTGGLKENGIWYEVYTPEELDRVSNLLKE